MVQSSGETEMIYTILIESKLSVGDITILVMTRFFSWQSLRQAIRVQDGIR